MNEEPGLNAWVKMCVDADGLGEGVFDRLVEHGHSVGEIRGGQAVIEPEDFSMGNSWGHKTSFAHPSCNDGTGWKMHLSSAHRATERGPSIPAFIPLATVRSHSVAPSPIR
jgi:hypothetical protein